MGKRNFETSNSNELPQCLNMSLIIEIQLFRCVSIARDVRMNMNCVRTNGSQHTPYAGPSGITSQNSFTFVKMIENHS